MRAAVACLLLLAAAGSARGQTCARADFEAVIDQASETLVQVTQRNAPAFQAKLRALKDKRGWTSDQLMKDGAVFVRDETIAGYDERSEQLLIKINGQGGASADCKVLAELRAAMAALVEAQTAKWAYMVDKIDKELAR